MQIIRGIEQGTDEWHKLRRGVLTASHAQAIANNGKGLDTYITELMEDYYRKTPKEYFISDDMKRGTELEPDARFCYEIETGNQVEEVAFIYYDKEKHIGCSPDGLIVGQEKGLELKCPNYKNHFSIVLSRDNIPSYWIWQIQYSMFVTGFQSWDFGSYCPECEKHFVTYEFTPDKEKQEMIKNGTVKGILQKLEIIKQVEGRKIITPTVKRLQFIN